MVRETSQPVLAQRSVRQPRQLVGEECHCRGGQLRPGNAKPSHLHPLAELGKRVAEQGLLQTTAGVGLATEDSQRLGQPEQLLIGERQLRFANCGGSPTKGSAPGTSLAPAAHSSSRAANSASGPATASRRTQL